MQLQANPNAAGVSAKNLTQPTELPFTLKDVRAAIPQECFEPSLGRSLAYFFFDIGIIAGLFYLAATIHAWWFWPIYWFAQGTMFWALFVVGHDCGHGSFSKSKWINNLVGHLSHTPILVPFHGWRISHRTHHANTGNLETDESWYPISEAKYDEMTWPEKLIRFYLPLIAYPVYLFRRSPSRPGGSHFLPGSPLFKPSEKWDVLTSTVWLIGMVSLLTGLSFHYGLGTVITYYGVPYAIFVMWLDLVTYLHHTEADIPWYSNEDWYFLKGALSTIDRDYGIFNPIHHDIGTHVAHHIFLSIPHYHLQTATEAIKPVLGSYYRKSTVPIWKSFFRSYRDCHFVANEGSPLYYQSTRQK
ncbi:MAG: fatty acid desaturase [Leptolyngbyaceae cyanobacterium]